jgi:hypothetical protein
MLTKRTKILLIIAVSGLAVGLAGCGSHRTTTSTTTSTGIDPAQLRLMPGEGQPSDAYGFAGWSAGVKGFATVSPTSLGPVTQSPKVEARTAIDVCVEYFQAAYPGYAVTPEDEFIRWCVTSWLHDYESWVAYERAYGTP